MCLSAAYLVMFLNVIGPDHVTSEPGRYVIQAETGEAHWVNTGDGWCTDVPQTEAAIRAAPVDAE